MNNLKILLVSAEVDPFAKSGGLADVAGSLPIELKKMGHDVRVVMPRYKSINAEMKYVIDFPVKMLGKEETCIIREGKIKDDEIEVPIYFVDNYHYFNREGMYCYGDDPDRFTFVDKAVLEMLPKIGFQPDIIHLNDWQAAAVALLLKEKYKKHFYYTDIATVYTVHNLQYQGNYGKECLGLLDLGEEYFTPERLECYGQVNYMKAGLLYSDVINTVSNTYVEEIKTQEYGEKLEGVVRTRENDLYGIINGIDMKVYNPETDEKIFNKYNINSLELKKENKRKLQEELGLPETDCAMLGIVTRLVDQKGLNLVGDILDDLVKNNNVQLVVLGLGDPYYENMFKTFAEKYPKKVSANIEFNDELAHKIYAASDMFLMPSRFEPCGLGQLIALRYGTVPVVRQTGGLADTIQDFKIESEEGNGFSFKDFNCRALMKTLVRALSIYKNMPDLWEKIVRRGMQEDYSWKTAADKYIELYDKAIEKKL